MCTDLDEKLHVGIANCFCAKHYRDKITDKLYWLWTFVLASQIIVALQ